MDTMTKCGWCGATLLPDDPRGQPRAYCSDSHRFMAYRRRRMLRLEQMAEQLAEELAELHEQAEEPPRRRLVHVRSEQ